MQPNDALTLTLDRLAEGAGGLDDWWVFSSTAARLLGLEEVEPADVDVIAGPASARVLIRRLRAEVRVTGHPRFQSDLFAVDASTPLPIELMSGFRIRTGETWTPVELQTRRQVDWRGRSLPVPEPHELAAVLRLLGRPKDLERAARLERPGG